MVPDCHKVKTVASALARSVRRPWVGAWTPRSAVVGAGVVGAAVALALARRGAAVTLLEAEPEPGLAASGTNSGIVHTGFDSTPGELETRADPALRGAARRGARCARRAGAPLRSAAAAGRRRRARRGRRARRRTPSATASRPSWTPTASLRVPGESVTDPVVYTLALAAAAELGAELRTGVRVVALRQCRGGPRGRGLRRRARARARGGQLRGTPRRRGGAAGRRRLLRDLPAQGGVPGLRPTRGAAARADPAAGPDERAPRECSCSPRSTARSWPVPTAVDQEDKDDWSVRPEAAARRSCPRRCAMHPPLDGAEPIASYAGLRPAGRGVNYAIGASAASPGARERGGRCAPPA